MTTPQKYPGEAVDFPLDSWLYEARPKPGCAQCADEKKKLDEAVKSGDANARFEAARNMRQCSHGARP
ncbi:hypothetical protein [Streptomyces sp. NPDC006012]|uniref:hypothetical protein n=1 Tax=Streptomyces sp. NPDC006012 TaxID=3364739 RepID=UPI0036AFC222